MAGRVLLDLFCEDRGHELFVTALLRRLAREVGSWLNIRTRNARGGHGRAVAEFKAWQRLMRQEFTSSPDVMVLVIDGNCQGWGEAHAALRKEVDETIFSRYAIGCPDPHIERWCIADPESFKEVVGADPPRADALGNGEGGRKDTESQRISPARSGSTPRRPAL